MKTTPWMLFSCVLASFSWAAEDPSVPSLVRQDMAVEMVQDTGPMNPADARILDSAVVMDASLSQVRPRRRVMIAGNA